MTPSRAVTGRAVTEAMSGMDGKDEAMDGKDGKDEAVDGKDDTRNAGDGGKKELK